MIHCVLVVLFLILFNNNSLYAKLDDEILQKPTFHIGRVIFQEAIYFGGGAASPVILNIVDGQRPEDGCADFLKQFNLPIDAELSVQQQLLAGICTRIAAIPNIKETCNNKPASNITFQIDLSAFKKEYLASQFAQFSVDEASLAFQEKDSKLIYFRQGYSISDILSFFCAIHISDCKIDNHQNSQLPLPDNANERFLEGLLEHAEGILSKIKIEEDQKKIMDTLKSKNYFEVLGVTFETSEADIRAAYKALARKYHPDKYQGDKAFATEALQYINTAYEVLSDDSKRKEHEHSLNPNIPNSNSGIHFQNGQGFQFSFGGGGGSFSFTFNF